MVAAQHENDKIAENIKAVRANIARAAADAGRDAGEVALMAVSKTRSADEIERAIAAGLTLFGENRVQEAVDKWPGIKAAHDDVELHLIGPLQTNKARDAVKLFDAIQSLDRPKLARTLARIMEEAGRRPDLFIQVNTGEEAQKSGVVPADLEALVELARDELALPVVGLMCIPPLGDHPGPHFALLAKLAARHGLTQLSMGMSDDYEAGVMLGATVVRVGTAIFGPREV